MHDRPPTGTLGEAADPSMRLRLGEERASRILERAAALDAKRSSEIEVGQLRDAAAQAGISREAFDEAMAELVRERSGGERGDRGAARTPNASEVAYYAELIRDLLGDDAEVVVVEDRIESRDGEGVSVSITPSSGDATAAVVAEGKLRRRLLAIALPALLPALFGLFVGMDEEDAGIGILLGVLLTVILSMIATVVAHRRERQALRKKAERLRRRLQRLLLLTAPDQG